ncbi:hypothetical protein AZF37_06840 [endosymbiont 'TC1' of Trimyema compressum]|nr:hypothetical protein AZF37_06840 [endosymbiont 'TC1' of Trimyema compressum]
MGVEPFLTVASDGEGTILKGVEEGYIDEKPYLILRKLLKNINGLLLGCCLLKRDVSAMFLIIWGKQRTFSTRVQKIVWICLIYIFSFMMLFYLIIIKKKNG